MKLISVIFSCLFFSISIGYNLTRNNPLLSRRKRYLSFPKGSAFVINLTITKPLLNNIKNPVTNFLGEVDVPFPLPTEEEIKKLKGGKRKNLHYRQRKDLYNQFENSINIIGVNGNSCMKRVLCEAKTYLPEIGKSLAGDVFSAIFDFYDVNEYNDHSFGNFCDQNVFEDCEISFLGFLVENVIKAASKSSK